MERIDVHVKEPEKLLKRITQLVVGNIWAFFSLKAFNSLKTNTLSLSEIGNCTEMELDEVRLVFAKETGETWVLQEIADAVNAEHYYYKRPSQELPENIVFFH